MALRPPPRAPPYSDYDDLISELSSQFNVLNPDGSKMVPPEVAQAQWTEPEIQMWFASGGQIAPADDPKLRAAALEMAKRDDANLKSPAQIEAEMRIKEAAEAAKTAPYFKLLTERDLAKAKVYRDAALTLGHPQRPAVANLFPVDDPTIRELTKTKHHMPFLKHILQWSDKDPKLCKAVYGDEGFTHGPSAALRGWDARFYWDASTLKTIGAVRFSQAAAIAWQHSDNAGEAHSHQADGTRTWSVNQVHGGCIEAVLDDLTAEVMKINVAPQNSTAELVVRIKMPAALDTTYKLEAEVTECSPPRCMTVGRIVALDGKVVAEATAKMAMMDRMGGGDAPEEFDKLPEVSDALADERSLTRVYAKAANGGGSAAPAVDVSDGGTIAGTLAQLKALQTKLVVMMQGEYFCDDVEPPAEAFGWDEAKLRDYFENGGA